MREGISVTAIFQIVIIFILLFTAIMAMTINNSNAFSVKDKIINAIEENNGIVAFDTGSPLDDRIVKPMQEASYRITGKCPKGEGYVGYDRDGRPVGSDSKASVCIRKVIVNDTIDDIYNKKYNSGTKTVLVGDFYSGYYFQVIMYYQLEMPIINGIYNLQTKGDTKIFYEKRSGIGTKVGA